MVILGALTPILSVPFARNSLFHLLGSLISQSQVWAWEQSNGAILMDEAMMCFSLADIHMQALSRFSILQVMESWVGPRNEASACHTPEVRAPPALCNENIPNDQLTLCSVVCSRDGYFERKNVLSQFASDNTNTHSLIVLSNTVSFLPETDVRYFSNPCKRRRELCTHKQRHCPTNDFLLEYII